MFAAIDVGYYPLAVIAMVTAAVAAYFYLRVAVLMYAGGGLGEPEGGTGGSAELDIDESMVGGGLITAAAPPEIPTPAWRSPRPSGRRAVAVWPGRRPRRPAAR